jgi:hypothetical protein
MSILEPNCYEMIRTCSPCRVTIDLRRVVFCFVNDIDLVFGAQEYLGSNASQVKSSRVWRADVPVGHWQYCFQRAQTR